jgi:succinate dehydrogenase/fumarate reductase cytochrome b subunit
MDCDQTRDGGQKGVLEFGAMEELDHGGKVRAVLGSTGIEFALVHHRCGGVRVNVQGWDQLFDGLTNHLGSIVAIDIMKGFRRWILNSALLINAG